MRAYNNNESKAQKPIDKAKICNGDDNYVLTLTWS